MTEEELKKKEEELKKKEEELKAAQNNNQYIEALKKMREHTVSKEDYEKLKAENNALLDITINNGTIKPAQPKQEEKEIKKEDIKALREKFLNEDNSLNNLDFVKCAIELRDNIIKKGGVDPFLPVGHKIKPTQHDIDCANRVAKVIKECIEFAGEDSMLFTNELQRRTDDVSR